MNQKKIKTENILIDKESYKYLVIYLINYVSSKFMKMLSLYYHEIMGKIEELKQKKIFDGWWLYGKWSNRVD